MTANTEPVTANTEPVAAAQIAAVRHFNRLYTRTIGVLDQHLFESAFSLTEARVLFEIAQRDNPSAKEIGASLGLDGGYLSRILQGFSEQGLLTRKPLPSDGRQHGLRLTARGRAAFNALDDRSRDDVASMLAPLAESSRARLVEAMKPLNWVLAPGAGGDSALVLRAHRPGDLGWVIEQNGATYAREYGWDISYEALVADIVSQFVRQFDPARERCWIAEVDGARVGAVFLVKQSDEVAKLRLLLVDPAARGLGVGKRLVAECIAFARACGYRKLTLWTQDILLAARRIYSHAGFVRVAVEPHRSFGQDLVGETWELDLSSAR